MVLTRSVRNVLTLTVALVALAASVWLVESNSARAASSTPVVYVATGENFPDALGAGPAAAMAKGPILLVTQNSIPGPTGAELNRLAPDKIVIVGGTAVISASVEASLAAYAGTVERIAGANRYDTAAKLSAATYPLSFDADTLDGKDSSAFVQQGEQFTTAWVVVNHDGTIGRQSGGWTVTKLGTGFYQVDHPDVNERAVGFSLSSYNRPGGLTSPTIPTAFANDDTGFYVVTYNTSGTQIDHDFSLVVPFVADDGLSVASFSGAAVEDTFGPDNS